MRLPDERLFAATILVVLVSGRPDVDIAAAGDDAWICRCGRLRFRLVSGLRRTDEQCSHCPEFLSGVADGSFDGTAARPVRNGGGPQTGPGNGSWAGYRFAGGAVGTPGVHRSAQFFQRLPLDGAVLGDARRRCRARWLVAADLSVRHLGLAQRRGCAAVGDRPDLGRPGRVCVADNLFPRCLSGFVGIHPIASVANAQQGSARRSG
jgi:hypothetical protein